MLSQSRDERRRLEREAGVAQQHAQNRPMSMMYEQAGDGGPGGGMPHADTAAAGPPSGVFDSIYEELDAGLQHVASDTGISPASRAHSGAGAGGRSPANATFGVGDAPARGYRRSTSSSFAVAAGSNDPRKSYMRGDHHRQHHHQQQHQQQPQRTVHPSQAQAALAQLARARQMQQQVHGNGGGSVRPASQQQLNSGTRGSQPRTSVQSEGYEPIALSHSVMRRQDRPRNDAATAAMARARAAAVASSASQGTQRPDIDSLVIYGNDRDDMSENSGLSQQRLLKKRHGHRLGPSSAAKNYPKRNPNKKSNVTILGMPDSLGGGSGKGQRNHQSSANAVPKTTENAYERRLARERMRSLVRIGSSRMPNRGGSGGGGGFGAGGMGGYDGVESVDGNSTSYAAPSPTRQQQQQMPAQRDLAGGLQTEQGQTPWWEGVDTTDQARGEVQPQVQQQQQRRIPRSDGSTDGHDGRGGYDFLSLSSPRNAASTHDSYKDVDDNAGNNAVGAFPPRHVAHGGYENGYPPATTTAAAAASSNGVPNIVPKRRADRPYLAHSSSAGKMMEPIVEEDGPIHVGGMEYQQAAATPPRDIGDWDQQDTSFQQQSSPLNRSGENLFNQYSINPVPNVPHRRNVGEGGGPSPRLGVPPAPTSYYDRPDSDHPALGLPSSLDQSYLSYNDDPNIVVGQWESPQDNARNDAKKNFPQDKYEAAAAAAAAAIAGESTFSPTSVAGEQQSSIFGATHHELNYDEANQDSSSGVRASTPNSVLTDEMTNPVPREMIRQRFSPDAEISQRPPRSSPQVSLCSGQISAIDSAAAVAPAPDPTSQSQEERDRSKRIEKAHAIRHRRVKEAREEGEELLRTSPQRSPASSYDGGSGPLSPVDETGMPRGQLPFPEDTSTEWEPDEKLPSKRDIQKGRASEDLKGRVIDLSASSSSKRGKAETPHITFQDAEFGFIEAVAAVVIQTFIRRYLAYKTAMIRYEAALTVKEFIINSTQARREAREQEGELEFAQRQAEVEAQKREKILAKVNEQARMLSEADAAAVAEAENECLQQEGGQEHEFEEEEEKEEERPVPRYSSSANLSEDELASKIQAAFRGWWVRDCLSVDNYCATLIQQAVRGYLRRMQYEFDFYRIVIVQSAVRRFIAKRKALMAREGAECIEEGLATQGQQSPKPRPAGHKSWSVPAPSGTTAAKSALSRPTAKTQSFAKPAPAVIDVGGGKGSLINAWKAREAQAKQQAVKPNIVYQNKSKVVESSIVEERRMVTNIANEAPTTAIVKTTKVQNSSVFTKTVQRVAPVSHQQQQVKSSYSSEQNAAATKIQARWRGFAAEMDYIHQLGCILLAQSLARRWVTMKLVLPYIIMARNGDFGDYDNGEYYDYETGEEGQYYDDYEYKEEQVAGVEGETEVIESVPAATSATVGVDKKMAKNSSAMNMWKEKEANAAVKPIARTGAVKVNTGATGGSVLQKWKQKEQEAIEKARRPGGR